MAKAPEVTRAGLTTQYNKLAGLANASGNGGTPLGSQLNKTSYMLDQLTQPAPAAAPAAPARPIGGGGGGAVAATQAAARPSLDDYINSNFLYTSQMGENGRLLDDFDAETLRGQQDVEAEQAQRSNQLQRSQADASIDSAEDFASRGLGRSGLVFQAQDKINAQGADQSNSIAQMLTDFLGQRQSGRVSQEQANRAALNDRINQLTTQFNSSQQIA